LESFDGAKYEKRNRVTLCRCGQSKNKPFCDSNHKSCELDLTETAKPDKGELIKGQGIVLRDIQSLCAGAGFCDRLEGTWQLINNKDKKSKDWYNPNWTDDEYFHYVYDHFC
jgi:hypothetical protein